MVSPGEPAAAHAARSERIVAVVVTYNRLDLLPQTLAGIACGQLVPHTVVIINNASTDGTSDYLDSLSNELNTDIVHLPQNVGGAGGFAVGIDRALARHQADLVWVMDDDTEPTANTLSEAYRAWADYSPVRSERPVFVASKVVWDDGRDHPMNTMRTMFAAGKERTQKAAAVGARPIRSASFVSVLLDAAAMRATELPLADFFIWNDDFEYTTRLAHHGNAIATEKSVALHHTKTFGTTDANPGPRFYNDVRNKLWVFCARRTLSPLEKLLYGGSTARLWASTLLRTSDKKTYTGYFLKGVRDAARGYRSNDQVLADVYNLETVNSSQRQRSHRSDSAAFSLLMSVYAKDKAHQLKDALRSNTEAQSLRPDEVVLVEDGPLSAELSAVLDEFEASASMPVKRLALPQNFGLAAALREGLDACAHDIVARADADDISLPHRFDVQIPLIANCTYDVVGSAMNEFLTDPEVVESVRSAPSHPRTISTTFATRNPMLHPTVVFRKSAVLAVGSYTEVPGAEDYWLWVRMNKAGFIFGNVQEPLVAYRVTEAYARRGGLVAFSKDYEVQRRLYNGGALSKLQWARNITVRSVYRFVPEYVRKKIFRAVTRGKTAVVQREGDRG